MDAKKEAILQHLHKKFPDEKIYREEFTRRNITTSIDYNVRKIAKDSNMTVTAWLRENGFDFRETGYIEPDMKSGSNPIKGENAVELADNIIKRYPLIGIFTPDEKQNEMLFTHAQKTVRKMITGNVRIAPEDELVLTVATVQLIKNRKPEKNEDEGGARTFWKYIYLQYGFQAEDHENAQTRVYNGFRTAIKNLRHELSRA